MNTVFDVDLALISNFIDGSSDNLFLVFVKTSLKIKVMLSKMDIENRRFRE